MDIERIYWKDEFSIGNTSIDHDHRKIIEIYNRIVDEVTEGPFREECAQLLTAMTNYAMNHFSKEEDYMKELAYPKLEEHRRFHMEYIYEVSLFNFNFFSTNDIKPVKVLKFLQKWWTEHIQNVDRDYENYKRSLNLDVKYEKTIY